MSLILDALKKLDREKAFIRKVTANIADEILKPDPVRPRKKFPLYLGGGLLSVCLTAALTYVVIVNLGLLARPAPPPGNSPPEPARQAEPLSPPPKLEKDTREEEALPPPKPRASAENKKRTAPEALPVRQPPAAEQTARTSDSGAAPQTSGRIAKEDSSGLSSKVRNPAEGGKPSGADSQPAAGPVLPKEAGRGIASPLPAQETAREAGVKISSPPVKPRDSSAERNPLPPAAEEKTGQNLIPQGTETVGAAGKAAESGPVRSGAAPPALRLTGIVWSEDSSGRYAVVNGAIVSEGAEIQGVKVMEILPNRVRFQDRGRPFEIQLF